MVKSYKKLVEKLGLEPQDVSSGEKQPNKYEVLGNGFMQEMLASRNLAMSMGGRDCENVDTGPMSLEEQWSLPEEDFEDRMFCREQEEQAAAAEVEAPELESEPGPGGIYLEIDVGAVSPFAAQGRGLGVSITGKRILLGNKVHKNRTRRQLEMTQPLIPGTARLL